MDYMIETTFLDSNRHLWDKRIANKMFSEFKNFQNLDLEESKERCLIELVLEFEQAYRLFLRKIEDLPMIMNCRVKGDSDSHFGGLECAELMRSFRFSCDKYLKESVYASVVLEGTIAYIISRIKEKAKEDEKYAWDIEKKVYRDYLSLGVDNTLEMLKSSGYKFGVDKNNSEQKRY